MVDHDTESSERPDPLTKLGGPIDPPRALEARVVGSLRARGLVSPSRPGRRLVLGALAIAATVAAFMLGRQSGARAAPSGPRWLLLLYEDQAFEVPAPGTEAVRVAEYRAWARATPSVVDGAELGPERYLVAAGRAVEPAPTAPDGIGELAGYFIISAPSWAEARAIAARCPHLEHRGRVIVRPLKAD